MMIILWSIGGMGLASAVGVMEPAKTLGVPLPAELAALDSQFATLQAERAAVPYNAAFEKLNGSYLNSIANKLAEEKAAANLDGVLALQAEQKLLAANQPVPESDPADLPATLKTLRGIYREAHAKLAAAFVANLNALVAPLDKRLGLLEADFVKTDRIADAKVVREYREVLKKSCGDMTLAFPPGGLKPTLAVRQADVRNGYTNSLGMKFVPVKGTEVLFCIHETRYKDFAAYAAAGANVAADWKNQMFDGFALGDRTEDHPVVNVSWLEAKRFCDWLGKKEGRTYRLPTDQEWSMAVGIGNEERWDDSTTPATVFKGQGTFPWGDEWPPPEGAGNYSDKSRHEKASRDNEGYLERYDDGFPTTAPVMSFKPNKLGLYDLGGNVLEWCESWYDDTQMYRVLRGGSWGRYDQGNLLSAFRRRMNPEARCEFDGFRVVMELDGRK